MSVLNSIYNHHTKLLIRNPEISTYFDLYECTTNLAPSKEHLESIYYSLSKYIHPDLFQNASEEQKALSNYYSELLNNGIKTLKNVFKTADYWLNLHTLRDTTNNRVPPEIMGHVFEIQEILSEDARTDDQKEELEDYIEHFEGLETKLKKQLLSLFEEHKINSDIPNENVAQLINALLNTYSYIEKLISQMEDALDS